MQSFSLGITRVHSIRSCCNEQACIPKAFHIRLGTFKFFDCCVGVLFHFGGERLLCQCFQCVEVSRMRGSLRKSAFCSSLR